MMIVCNVVLFMVVMLCNVLWLWLKVVPEPYPLSNDGVSAFTRVHQLREQLVSMPDERKPPTNRIPLDTGYSIISYPAAVEDYHDKNVSKKAEEIVNKFEKMQTDSSETINVQSPPTVKQVDEEDTEHVRLPSFPSMDYQEQYQFALDQV